jgi:hypothetical protein
MSGGERLDERRLQSRRSFRAARNLAFIRNDPDRIGPDEPAVVFSFEE